MRLITTIMLFLFAAQTTVWAQEDDSWEDLYLQLMDIDEAESEDWESNIEDLSQLALNPLNINTATTEDLQQLNFLSAQQIEDIEAYIYRHGKLQTMGELAMIESIDGETRRLLSHFIYIDQQPKQKSFPSLSNIMKYGQHELMATAQVPFYKRKGDENGYLGYQYRHWLRYSFSRGEWVKAGIVASQDAGEPFFAHHNNTGYDYYSFYLTLRKLGRLKALAVGRYRIKLGMGLVINNSLGFGKLATLATLGYSSSAIRAHSSRSESNYLQGAAATVNILKGLDLTAFASYRDRDATLNDDGSAATLLTTGYHRTESEMERKHNTHLTTAGGNVNYAKNGFHVGATALYASLSRSLSPNTKQIYRQYFPSGDSFWNASIDYGYMSRRLNISGETATGNSGGIATINTISYELKGGLQLMALQRFYSYKYYSLFSRSFADGSSVQNESGVYIGASWKPLAGLTLMGYCDYAYHPWAIYQADQASHGWDYLLGASYNKKKFTLRARYRLRRRERNGEQEGQLIWRNEQRARLQLDYNTKAITARTQIDVAACDYKEKSFGWMVSESITWATRKIKLSGNVAYFNTDDYNSRVYTYERGMLYEFNFPVFYGEGIRYALTVRADISRRLMLQGKIGVTDYFDRDHISTGLQQIDGSSKTDLWLQVKWKI